MKFKIYLFLRRFLGLEEGVWRTARPMEEQKTARKKGED